MSAFHKILVSVLGIAVVILIGTIGFMFTEGLGFFDALWLSMITLLTVGYGDSVPQTFHGKIFTLIIIPIGIGIISYALAVFVGAIVQESLSRGWDKKRMEQKINKLHNHVIVCGMGRVGEEVIAQLINENIPIVVVDNDPVKLNKTAKNIHFIQGDATEDNVLNQSGIERAAGLVATLPLDAHNVFISLTAKGMNPNIHIIARAEKTESEEKLRRAGADKVLNPASIVGRRMAMSILKPDSVDLLDTIFHTHQGEFRFEDIIIQSRSILNNKMIKELKIREQYGVNIVAIKRGDTIISNPGAEDILKTDDLVIVFGSKKQLDHFQMAAK